MGNHKFISCIFIISIFFLLCKGAYAYFTWFIDFLPGELQLGLYGVFTFIAYSYKQTNKITIFDNHSLFLLYILFILACIYPSFVIGRLLLSIFSFYPVLVLFCDQLNIESNLNIITKMISVLLIPGLIIWGLQFFRTIDAPIILYPDLREGYTFYNYYVNISLISNDRFGFSRFQSVFLEPGYCGVVLSFLIYANKFEFKKWQNKVCLLGLIASFSLAGYIVTVMGYLFSNSANTKAKRNIFISCLFLGIIYGGAITYNNGNNILNNTIISRLQFDEEKGIEGNNRYSDDVNVSLEQSMNDGSILLGDPSKSDLGTRGRGLQVYVLTHGIVGVLFVFLFYMFPIRFLGNKRYGYGFVFVVFATFLQASNFDSYSWLIPFFLGIGSQMYLEKPNESYYK